MEVHPLKISSEEEDEEGGSTGINDVMLYRPKIAFNYQRDSRTSWDAPFDPFLSIEKIRFCNTALNFVP